jgi:hypothetical protein
MKKRYVWVFTYNLYYELSSQKLLIVYLKSAHGHV